MTDPARVLGEATRKLAAAGVDGARWDAEQLLAVAAGVSRGRLSGLGELDAAVRDRFHDLVERRSRRIPLQHLVGSVGFRYIDVEIGPGVFIPRPETEVVAGAAIELARAAGPRPVVVDLCSGSGVIALSVANELPAAAVHAVELDPDAAAWLRRNAAARQRAGDSPIAVHLAAAADALPELDGQIDVVVSNPPYVAHHEMDHVQPEVRDHDPKLALVADDDGLSVIREVVNAAQRLLRAGGWVVVEHSDRQGEVVPELLRAAGFVDVVDAPDLARRPRFAKGRWTA